LRLPDWTSIHEERGFHGSTPFLAMLSFLYGLGIRLRLLALRRKRKRKLPGFVVSMGNLTTGGTGKTPATIMMAQWALDKGYRAAVLSRGYGGNYQTKVLALSDIHNISAVPVIAGDEPCLIARRLRSVPVIVSRDRYLAGLKAHQDFGTDFFILDDGFQHLMLKRDLNVLLIEMSEKPFGNGHLLPWGPLREPVKQAKRADAVILTRSGSGPPGYALENRLRRIVQGKPFFRAEHIPEKVIFPIKGTDNSPWFLQGKRVIAFAGIARPKAFEDTLIELGADVLSFSEFRDHHPYSRHELDALISEKEKRGAEFLITTEKDWVRLEGVHFEFPDLCYLVINFSLLPGEERFFNMVSNRLEKRLMSRKGL
jgi:tetraacyldisaccharide 4'-kinase